MRFDKFTTKLQEALADAQSRAVGQDHQYIEPQHLLLALLEQEDGGASALVAKSGGNGRSQFAATENHLVRTPGGWQQAGEIIAAIEKAGFRILAMRMTRVTRPQAEGFYAVHREKPFFTGLIAFMTEGPVIVMALERENAIIQWREIMGATNPANADEGTIRKKFAESIEANAIHGSDGEDTAKFEIGYFFAGCELV